MIKFYMSKMGLCLHWSDLVEEYENWGSMKLANGIYPSKKFQRKRWSRQARFLFFTYINIRLQNKGYKHIKNAWNTPFTNVYTLNMLYRWNLVLLLFFWIHVHIQLDNLSLVIIPVTPLVSTNVILEICGTRYTVPTQFLWFCCAWIFGFNIYIHQ